MIIDPRPGCNFSIAYNDDMHEKSTSCETHHSMHLHPLRWHTGAWCHAYMRHSTGLTLVQVMASAKPLPGSILLQWPLTHWGRDKLAAILQTTFSSAFPWMKAFEFWIRFHWDMKTSSNGNIFRVTGRLCGEFTGPRSPVNSPHKVQWHGALMFSLICVWINDWVNSREAGDLRR